MLTTTEKTLYMSDEDRLILWIKYINEGIYDINVTDKLTHTTYRVAEYDGYKYIVLNQKAFDGIFYTLSKEHPSVLTDIRSFVEFHKPDSQSFSEMCKRLSNKYRAWVQNKKNSIKKLWKKP